LFSAQQYFIYLIGYQFRSLDNHQAIHIQNFKTESHTTSNLIRTACDLI